ncbi:MAG: chemotaxis protein [Pyramidobacter sp.]
MQDVVTGWTADKEAVKILRHGLTDLNAEISAQAEDTRRQLTELKQELAAERKRYNVAIRRSRGQGLLIGIILGITVNSTAR